MKTKLLRKLRRINPIYWDKFYKIYQVGLSGKSFITSSLWKAKYFQRRMILDDLAKKIPSNRRWERVYP